MHPHKVCVSQNLNPGRTINNLLVVSLLHGPDMLARTWVNNCMFNTKSGVTNGPREEHIGRMLVINLGIRRGDHAEVGFSIEADMLCDGSGAPVDISLLEAGTGLHNRDMARLRI